ncbi:MAG: hypothetical protein HDS89_08535 [Bacteroidales bacterium]|nr:hypothetical protein [Bacteroidales bacterium]
MEKGYIHFIKAQFGDAFILHCRKGENKGIIVIDGGYGINSQKNRFLSEIKNIKTVDLMVLTHPDDDHLMGIKEYIKNHLNDEPFPVKEIWANCAPNVEINLDCNLSARKAYRLSETLVKLQDAGKTIWRNDICGYQTCNMPFADIHIVGPSCKTLQAFVERYRDEIGYDKVEQNVDVCARDSNNDLKTDMKTLATRTKRKCDFGKFSDASNASSISLIISCNDFSILMLGDTFPDDIVEGLTEMGYSPDKPLKVDYVKMPHHGSAQNISNELLDMIDCQNYIISTNGAIYHHPDREALANVLCHDKRDPNIPINFYFNYPLEVVEETGKHIFNETLDQNLNYAIFEPSPEDKSGLVLMVP